MTTNKKKLLISDSMGKAGWDLLAARDDIEAKSFPHLIAPADLVLRIRAEGGVDGVAIGPIRFGEAELAEAPRLRVVARIGVGYDSVDVPALTKRGIPLMVVGIANSPSVAEQAIFFMMTLARRGAHFDALVKEGRWPERLKVKPVDLLGKTALIVGFGRIGTRTAKRCLAMEMAVLVYDPYVPAESVRAAGYEPVGDLDAAVARADFVSIHCPKTPETLAMFDAARLRRMKPSAYLVNTARGGIIEETALHAALVEGRLAGAGLDVFALEPTPTDNPLLKLPNVVTAPHMAGVTVEAVARMALAVARNIMSVFDGSPIRENVINQEVLG
ncbi:MAG TPA: hydroxyacid dehydrogenase [Alphaproteobacteria bacterium]|nr:hydroxyacid dehydrogenase [Alphaproteobacteria bacterium]